MKKETKKFKLNRETLRQLTNVELGQVAGGALTTTWTERWQYCGCKTWPQPETNTCTAA
jgi:hypothetical protein